MTPHDTYVRTFTCMGTVVTLRTVGTDDRTVDAVDRATDWFRHVESTCSRFDSASELRRLCSTSGAPIAVSRTLFEAIQFALAVAEATDGAFDPTVGRQMEARGFDRLYTTDERVSFSGEGDASIARYTDISVDADACTVTLHTPLLLDLGAVAKGLAVDMAARELADMPGFSIDAGGDLYLGGHNEHGAPWSVGIRDPRATDRIITRIDVSDRAVCTSGDYARRTAHGHHILDPRGSVPDHDITSSTVIADSAMVADALSTAAFVLGGDDGLALLERHGVQGMLVVADGTHVTTAEWPRG